MAALSHLTQSPFSTRKLLLTKFVIRTITVAIAKSGGVP
jgi:hypothetical protein